MNGSRIAALVTAGIRCLCAGAALSEQSWLHVITNQWQDPEILIVIRVYDEKLGHMLKPLVPKFPFDLSFR